MARLFLPFKEESKANSMQPRIDLEANFKIAFPFFVITSLKNGKTKLNIPSKATSLLSIALSVEWIKLYSKSVSATLSWNIYLTWAKAALPSLETQENREEKGCCGDLIPSKFFIRPALYFFIFWSRIQYLNVFLSDFAVFVS